MQRIAGIDFEAPPLEVAQALIGVTVMAINLGEVLVELASAIAIGFALAHLLAVRRRRAIADRVQVRM